MKKIIAIAFLLGVSGMYGMECEEEEEKVSHDNIEFDWNRESDWNLPPKEQAKRAIAKCISTLCTTECEEEELRQIMDSLQLDDNMGLDVSLPPSKQVEQLVTKCISGICDYEDEEASDCTEEVSYTVMGLEAAPWEVNFPPNAQAKELMKLIRKYKGYPEEMDIILFLRQTPLIRFKEHDVLPSTECKFIYQLRIGPKELAIQQHCQQLPSTKKKVTQNS